MPEPETVATKPVVIGLDLSLTATGVASSAGWCERVGKANVTKMALPVRVRAVDAIARTVLEYAKTADLVVIEAPQMRQAYGGLVERIALTWLIIRALTRAEIPVALVNSSSRMRYATGKGQATKAAIVDAVARRWPDYRTGGDDNLCDAIVLAAMGADHLGAPITPMPQTHRAALAAVEWPGETLV